MKSASWCLTPVSPLGLCRPLDAGAAITIAAMLRRDFHYELPRELIAERPLPERSASRLLVLDGAYAEYAPDGGREDWAFADAPNVLVTRTFSKLYGLASLRIGWGYGPAPVIDVLNRIRLPFNVPGAGQAAALAALGDDAFVQRSIAHAIEGRARLGALFTALGWRPIPSAANFVTVQVPPPLRAAEHTIHREDGAPTMNHASPPAVIPAGPAPASSIVRAQRVTCARPHGAVHPGHRHWSTPRGPRPCRC